MDSREFEDVLEKRINTIRKVLGAKEKEYARNSDRLSNFKKAAMAQGITPEKALRGIWFKHVISIVDFVDDLDNGTSYSYDRWNEKITDALNYLILLDALIQERLERLRKREAMQTAEFVTFKRFDSYAKRIERKNFKRYGHSLSFSAIARRANDFIVEIQSDRKGMLIRKGWRQAMAENFR
ncbi:MAG: hypothetical protein IBX72_14170 [Nitrospirae bacterium]|nr:hypothetical protein [Nitrospirota bacterium]